MTKQEKAQAIILDVATSEQIPPLELLKTRKYKYTAAKDRIIYLLDEIGLKRREIAGIFNWSNPTVGLHAIKRVVNRMHTSDNESAIINNIRRKVHG